MCPADASTAHGGPLHVGCIGNSLTYYNAGLDHYLVKLGLANEAARHVKGGACLESLWREKQARKFIEEGRFDAVVIQEDLPETNRESFLAHAELFIAAVRRSGARPLLLMAWGYARLPAVGQKDIIDAHRVASERFGVDVAPVGRATRSSNPR